MPTCETCEQPYDNGTNAMHGCDPAVLCGCGHAPKGHDNACQVVGELKSLRRLAREFIAITGRFFIRGTECRIDEDTKTDLIELRLDAMDLLSPVRATEASPGRPGREHRGDHDCG